MFVGHYAVSLGLKKVDPSAGMGQLFFAVQLADVAWSSLVLLGVEKVEYQAGFMAASPLNLYYMPYTHSLVGALLWSLLAAVFYLCVSRRPIVERRRTALIMGVAVLSHWLLDLPVHGPDLPLIGNAFKVGLGLWNYPLAAYLVESALLVTGYWLYTKERPAAGKGMGLFSATLLLVNAVNLFFAPPFIPEWAYAAAALASYALFASIAGRLDRGSGAKPVTAGGSSPRP